MEWWVIVLCILFNAIWIVPLIHELVISPIKEAVKRNKKNNEWVKKNGQKLAKLCLNCHYCKWFWYHPFYKYGRYGGLKIKTPTYCRKFKKPLSYDPSIRCIGKDYEEIEYE